MKIEAISILAGHYEQPIADLVFKLAACKRDEEYPLLATYHEVSYSVAIAVLLVMMFESYVARIQYRDINSKQRGSALKYLESVPNFKRRLLRLKEVFILRDAIAHNHVHAYDQRWNKAGKPTKANFDLNDAWQANSAKYRSRVVRSRRSPPRTKLLRLNVSPSLICRDDVRQVFLEVHSALAWLHKNGHLDLSVENNHVRFVSMKSGKERKHYSFPFWELSGEI